MDLTVYTFEDAAGNKWGTYYTQRPDEAKEYAQQNSLRVIENVYEWQEALPVEGWDFTK